MLKNDIFLYVHHFVRKNNTEILNKKIKLVNESFYDITDGYPYTNMQNKKRQGVQLQYDND